MGSEIGSTEHQRSCWGCKPYHHREREQALGEVVIWEGGLQQETHSVGERYGRNKKS